MLTVPATFKTADIVRTLKANSSRWMREVGHSFAWQDGYAAISVIPSQVPTVVHYIENQAEQHSKHSFESEYTSLLTKSGITFDVNEAF